MLDRFTGYKRLLALAALNGGGASIIERTATGNPLTFATNIAKPLKSLLIPFTPQQEGTGDPSPQNIRPILPWNGLTVVGGGKNLAKLTYGTKVPSISSGQMVDSNGWSSDFIRIDKTKNYYCSGNASLGNVYALYYGADYSYLGNKSHNSADSALGFSLNSDSYFSSATYVKLRNDSNSSKVLNIQLEEGSSATPYEAPNITETDISFASPVYGGTLDVVSGVLTVEWGRYDLGQLSWELKSNGNNYWFYSGDVPGLKIISDSGILSSIMCERYKTVRGAYIYNGSAGDNVVGQDGDVPRIRIRDDSYNNDADAFKTALSGVYLYFELATPQEQTLTGHQITALVGDNTIWSDADGEMTAVYLLTESFGDDHPISGGLGSGLLGGGFGSGSGESDEPSEPVEPDQPDEPAEPDQPAEE